MKPIPITDRDTENRRAEQNSGDNIAAVDEQRRLSRQRFDVGEKVTAEWGFRDPHAGTVTRVVEFGGVTTVWVKGRGGTMKVEASRVRRAK